MKITIKKTLEEISSVVVDNIMCPEDPDEAAMLMAHYARKFAALGGSARTARKAASSRINGKKGGRPRRDAKQS